MAASKTITATATNDSTTSAKFDVRGFSCGSFIVPTSVTGVDFYAATSETDAAPDAIYSPGPATSASILRSTTAGTVLVLPKECFSVQWLVIVLTGSASASITLTLGTSDSSIQAGGVAISGSVAITNSSLTTIATNTGGAQTALQIMDDWDESDRAKVNPIVGQAGVAAGAGAVSATVQRVTLASDDPGVASLQVIDDTVSGSGATAALRTQDAGPAWTTVFGVTSAVVTSADMTTATAVTAAPTSGQKLVITDIIVSADTTMFVLFQEETSGTTLFKVWVPANGTVQITPRGKVKLATADKKLTADASVAGNIAVTAIYYSEA